jgi:hypothetical protein
MISLITLRLFSQQKAICNPVKLWAISHPIAALKIKKINKQCLLLYANKDVKQKLDSFSSGGKLDAFRHIFFMAAFQQKVKTKKLRKLGIAHENQNYRQFLQGESNSSFRHDSLSMIMDLNNNEIAFSEFATSKQIALDSLKEHVIQLILQGKALILKRNRKGDALSCEGSVIKTDKLNASWQLPYCLVKSDYRYED